MPRIYMFDAYGTLFDVHAAVARAGAPLGANRDAISALWRTKQLEYSWTRTLMGLSRTYDFWALTEQALDFALARFGVADAALRDALLDAYRVLDAYPDVAPLLDRLKAAGKETAVFTNGSYAMVNAAIAAAGLAGHIDHVLSVERGGLYKPAPDVYADALYACGAGDRSEILFFSSNRWDVAGATAFGFRSVWVNRTGQPDEYPDQPPYRVVASLASLPPEL